MNATLFVLALIAGLVGVIGVMGLALKQSEGKRAQLQVRYDALLEQSTAVEDYRKATSEHQEARHATEIEIKDAPEDSLGARANTLFPGVQKPATADKR